MAPPPGTLTSWGEFCAYASAAGAEFFGFVRPLPDVNRFAARYRAASAFRGVVLDGYSDTTAAGYGELTRLLFTYSTFEVFLQICGKSQSTIGPELERAGAIGLLKTLRAIDTDSRFYEFLHERVNPAHKTELENYMANDPCNVAYLASAVRHIFAHGWLTPNAGGGEAAIAARICSELSGFLLYFMDQQFTTYVHRGLEEIHGA